LNGGTIDLDWETASELNNDYFTVEKSMDGRTFTPIAEVAGSGTSTEPIRYSYTDNDPFIGANYYRLRQTDFDGTESYSNVILLEYLSTERIEYKVFPNPTTGNQFIAAVVGLLPDQTVNIEVTDLAGRRYMNTSYKADLSGKVYESIDFPDHAPAGTYIVKINSVGFTENIRLIKK